MPVMSPFDVLADEIGAVAGRIEREVKLRVTAAVADLERRDAERELRLVRLEQAAAERLAGVKDGLDGKDGLIGPEGPQGPAGLPGERGLQGEAGKDGEDGAAGQEGPEGPQGPPGERGLLGEPGKDGVSGERGLDGPPGEPGLPGIDGQNGRDGVDGKDGLPGVAGLNGADGARGEQGERGIEGPPGKLPIVRSWAEGIHYEGAVVTRDGGLWQAQCDTGKEWHPEDWTPLAVRGADGRTPELRGTYDAAETYRYLDIVSLDGGSFVAKRDDPGACPGEGWKRIVDRGKPGRPGERGLPGSRGDPGAAAPRLVSWELDVKGYGAVPVLSDGTRGPVLSVREFLEALLIERGL